MQKLDPSPTMKIALFIISIMLFLAGLTFFLQGINVLPGSYMTGDPQWAINGAIIMVVSGGLLWFARRR
jgi:divalent metal cation (Fe/Co/Zn/Cd) transporter